MEGSSKRLPDRKAVITVRLPRGKDCAARARDFVSRQLGAGFSRRIRDDAQLVASELVTNAYRHGNGKIELRLEIAAHRMRIEVVDEGSGAHVVPRDRGGVNGGWGLQLVEALADRWGAFEGTTHVWAELAW